MCCATFLGNAALLRLQAREGRAIALPPASPIYVAQRPVRSESVKGIACMALGMFLFSAGDMVAKLLTETVHPVQVVWSRQLGLLLGVVVLLLMRGPGILRSANPGLQIARGVLAVCSATLFIVAIGYVPLADAVAVTFVAPFLVTVMGALILRERVGPRRWAAVAVGFLGMLIVIRPGMGVVHPAMLLIMAAAFFFAMRQILSRMLSGGDRVETTVAYTAITSSLILTVPLPFFWQTPDMGRDLPLLIAVAVLAAGGEVLVIKSLELAQAVVLAPVHFWTWIGAAVIMGTGLYVVHRERLAKE